MKDSAFKILTHNAYKFTLHSKGSKLADGYKPDYVLRNGNDFIIIECDTGTSRKGLVGGMIKAAKFLTGEKTGRFVSIIKEKENTTVLQIANHLEEYFDWVKDLTNLSSVSVIAIDKYCPLDEPLRIFGKEFNKHALTITINR